MARSDGSSCLGVLDGVAETILERKVGGIEALAEELRTLVAVLALEHDGRELTVECDAEVDVGLSRDGAEIDLAAKGGFGLCHVWSLGCAGAYSLPPGREVSGG